MEGFPQTNLDIEFPNTADAAGHIVVSAELVPRSLRKDYSKGSKNLFRMAG